MRDRDRLIAAIEAALPGISPERAAAMLRSTTRGDDCGLDADCAHSRELAERNKELTAIRAASSLLQDDTLPPERLLQGLADLLPLAMLHPEDSAARIFHGSISAATPGFDKTPSMLRCPFQTGDGEAGAIEVACFQSRGREAVDPFLPEERALLATLGEMLRAALDRRAVSAHLHALVATGKVRLFVLDPSTNRLQFPGLSDPDAPAGDERPLTRSRHEAHQVVHPDDRERVIQAVDAALASSAAGDAFEVEYRSSFPGPHYEWRHLKGHVIRDAAGRPLRMLGITIGIQRERTLQEQLLQAQKMEALGRLAGAVAHDFNNILSTILGYSDLASKRLPEDSDPRRYLAEVSKAGASATGLVRQILAFGRRQELRPQRVDLGRAIGAMDGMLTSLLGKRIALRVDFAPDASAALVDPGQFQQVVLNLCVNARDAMGEAGTLTLRVLAKTAGAPAEDGSKGPPKAWTALEVEDTGAGIPPEVRARIFEPFFTTKEEGKGTGLGLATVHGIVTQSGGFIEVDSEVGRGTLFRAHFPVEE
jgi:two-component system cell cycle sensor histidine kinase/response regulator CckA